MDDSRCRQRIGRKVAGDAKVGEVSLQHPAKTTIRCTLGAVPGEIPPLGITLVMGHLNGLAVVSFGPSLTKSTRRIDQFQSLESQEIPVRRTERCAGLDGKCGQRSIRHQRSEYLRPLHLLHKDRPEGLAGRDDHYLRQR